MNDATAPTDAAIVRQVLAGDREAFAWLVDRHHDRCLRLAAHLLGDAAEAEDVVQEALLRAYRHLGGYREHDRFGAWLTRILVNQCRTAAARRRRPVPPTLDWGLADGVAEHPAEALALQEERAELLRGALALLPDDQREAVVLRHADGMSFDEIAAVTGASVAACKMRVQRGCRRLRALLDASDVLTGPSHG
jgi:RNA polymerase sigma-70 factor (ECF subfamily)